MGYKEAGGCIAFEVQVTQDQHNAAFDWLMDRFGALLIREDIDNVSAMIEHVVMEEL